MNDYIKWCKCGHRILTTKQIEENKPCAECQHRHAKDFKNRLDDLISKEDWDG